MRFALLFAFAAALSSGCGVSNSGVASSKTVADLNADEKLALCEYGLSTFTGGAGAECGRSSDCGVGCSLEITFAIAESPVSCADFGLPLGSCTVREVEAEIDARNADFCVAEGVCGMVLTRTVTVTQSTQ